MQHHVLPVLRPLVSRRAPRIVVPPRVVRELALVALLAGVPACGDRVQGTEPPTERRPESWQPPPGLPVLEALRGTVDVLAGTMTFEPAAGTALPSTSAIRGQVYGDQGVTVRVRNTPVTTQTIGGKRRYSAQVGLQNLLPHPIGDEQAGLVTTDTMGIYVFVSGGPTVVATSSPCAACTVVPFNHQGTLTLDQPGRRYWHWQERVGAAGSASDTTLARRTWTFEADTAVTRFSFEVLVSAAWPPPHETSWKIEYAGDSIPDTQEEPRWRRYVEGTGTSASNQVPGILRMSAGPREIVRFFRRDSVPFAGSAYVEARMALSSQQVNRAEARVLLDDGARFIAVGIARDKVWFTDSSNTFLPGAAFTALTTANQNTYQVRKYAADSVVLVVNGARVGALPYGQLPQQSGGLPLVMLGNRGIVGSSVGDWDYVIYGIGRATP